MAGHGREHDGGHGTDDHGSVSRLACAAGLVRPIFVILRYRIRDSGVSRGRVQAIRLEKGTP